MQEGDIYLCARLDQSPVDLDAPSPTFSLVWDHGGEVLCEMLVIFTREGHAAVTSQSLCRPSNASTHVAPTGCPPMPLRSGRGRFSLYFPELMQMSTKAASTT